MQSAQEILKSFIGDRGVLIFENDISLSDSIENFYLWCVENKIHVNILFAIDELPESYIDKMIWPDAVLAFMTTSNNSDIAKTIVKVLANKKGYRLRAIECYINSPEFKRKPEPLKELSAISLDSYEADANDWHIEELK